MNTIELQKTNHGTWVADSDKPKARKATTARKPRKKVVSKRPVSRKRFTLKSLTSKRIVRNTLYVIGGTYPILLALEWLFIG